MYIFMCVCVRIHIHTLYIYIYTYTIPSVLAITNFSPSTSTYPSVSQCHSPVTPASIVPSARSSALHRWEGKGTKDPPAAMGPLSLGLLTLVGKTSK